jgi:hypothetical protein
LSFHADDQNNRFSAIGFRLSADGCNGSKQLGSLFFTLLTFGPTGVVSIFSGG